MLDLRVVVYSYFPPRSDHLAGGAQHVVHDLLRGLVDRVALVDVVCPVVDNDDQVDAHSNLRVHPVLLEPAQDVLTPHERELNLRHLAALAEEADVILTVDRAFPLQLDQPVLLLLNNFSYGTEVDSVFSFTWDAITVPSPYLAEAVSAVAGPASWEGSAPLIRVASPGVDRTHFCPTPPDEALSWLGLEPGGYVAFPHRPDPAKGFDVALGVIQTLRRLGEDFRLLVPKPPKSVLAVRSEEQHFVALLDQRVAEVGLEDAVILHPWVPHRLLPSYYSLADCCLVPSRLPEGFGLTVLQAVSCGTPVVATPAGAIPGLLPAEHGLTIVSFDDIDALAAATLSAIRDGHVPTRRGAEFIGRRYSVDRYVDLVITHLTTTTKSNARYSPRAWGCDT